MFFFAALLGADGEPPSVEEFPIQLCEGLLWMEVRVPQSRQPLRFLLDSGAGVSVINLKTAQRLGVALGRRVSVEGVHATMDGYWPLQLQARSADVELPFEYLALDLDKLSGACQRTVDGLIGADFFRRRAVQIDFTAQKLRVIKPAPEKTGVESIPLQVDARGLRVPVRVNGRKLRWVRLDTGCASALQWVTSDVPADPGAHKARRWIVRSLDSANADDGQSGRASV